MRVRKQRSIRYFEPNLAGGMDIPSRFGQFYTHMFIEDIGAHIWPSRAKGKVAVELKPPEKALQAVLTSALKGNGYGNSFASNVERFIEAAAEQVAEFDFALAEIVFTEDTDTKATPEVNFVWLNPRQIE